MIIEEMHPFFSFLIEKIPSLFNKTEIIGIYDGKYLCSSFLKNSNLLESITLYENFKSMKTESQVNKFQEMYDSWKNKISNLKIELNDGKNFTKESTYLHIDISNDKLDNFVKTNWNKLKEKKCISFYGYKENPCNTLLVSKLILEDLFFPFLLHSGVIFGTTSLNSYNDNYKDIEKLLVDYDIDFSKDPMHTYTHDYYILNTHTGWKTRQKSYE